MKNYLPDHILENCLDSGSLMELDRYLAESFSDSGTSNLDYPYSHRICDLRIKSQCYRLIREVFNNTEKLYVLACDEQSVGESTGVPYPLKAEQLQRWINDEESEDIDSESPSCWQKYLKPKVLEKYYVDLKRIAFKKEAKTNFVVLSNGKVKKHNK